jgi:oligopeptide transport system permease protein
MLRHALLRLASSIPTLLVLVTLTFFLLRAAPGGPFDEERVLPPDVLANLERTYHLHEPLWEQFGRYLAGVFTGDLGASFQYTDATVGQLIAEGAPVSFTLGALAMALALLVGGTAGILAALRRGRVLDRLLMALSVTGLSIPSYVVAPLLVLVFAVTLGWLPAGGWEPGRPLDLVLPVIALALPQAAVIARLVRGAMLESLGAPHVRTARAKGLPPRVVVLRHALRPALMPVLSYLGPALAGIVTGSVVIEQIFGVPGIGRHFVQAALNRDYPLVMGVVLFYGALIILFNFVVDVLYGVLDPRVRTP